MSEKVACVWCAYHRFVGDEEMGISQHLCLHETVKVFSPIYGWVKQYRNVGDRNNYGDCQDYRPRLARRVLDILSCKKARR